ncbi:putative transposase [Orientia tsutsugamushi str. TA763]|nr:putative transposase [Orientia tsutsugamushi str. TA763]
MHLSRFLDPKNDVAFKRYLDQKKQGHTNTFSERYILFEGNREITEVEFLGTILDADIASKKNQ